MIIKRAFLLMGVVVLSAACAKKVTFPGSPVVPAAEARAKLESDDNGNTRISLRIKHLAQAKKLHPPQATYVVWLQTPDGRVVNLGQLSIGDNLAGELETVSPFREFRLFVSAEPGPEIWVPSGQTVLATEILRAR